MATTYQGLQDEIFAWINRAEIFQAIPTFIRQAEARFNREVRCRQMVRRQRATVTGRLALPSDWLEAINMELVDENPGHLLYVSPHELDKTRDTYQITGCPTVYSLVGNEIEFAPEPDGLYTIEMLYYGKVPALTGAATTNWMLDEHPDLYLYASLVFVEPFLGRDDRVALWKGMADKLIADVNGADDRAKVSGGPLIPRIPTFD